VKVYVLFSDGGSGNWCVCLFVGANGNYSNSF
jgi:hypothetical protein